MEAMDTRKAIYWRGRLRGARNSALGDSEGFLPIVQCMERMGNQLAAELGKNPPGGLSKKLKIIQCMLPGMAKAAGSSSTPGFETLAKLVCRGRNDAVHIGATARALTRNAVRLSLLIEDALMDHAADRICDYMTPHPVCAEAWQQVGLVRQTMMEHQFDYLPIRNGADWRVLTSIGIAKFLAGADGKEKWKRLHASIHEALKCKTRPLECSEAVVVPPGKSVACAIKKTELGQPILVVKSIEEKNRLEGIVTAFDLL
ncbi:MAG: hypothetical protein OXC08_10575 [Thiotrichales bacterium]|nr:hypothetical protein [Thiotrichales bacterium]